MPTHTRPGRIARGIGFVLRVGAAPLALGLRWALHRIPQPVGLPTPRRGVAFSSKAALDEFFLASELVRAPIVPLSERHRLTREIAETLAFLEQRGWLEDPAGYHQEPPGAPQVASAQRRGLLPYRHVRFHSDFAPHADAPGRRRWLSYRGNRTAHAWLLEHPGRPRPWILCVPGYRMGHPVIDFTGFRARWLHRTLGLNVAIPVMPLHGPRRTGRFGGDGFFSGDFVDTLHAQAQAVWDTRRLVTWLREARQAPAIGAYGVSLGGYTAALLSTLEDQLACVIAGIPATDFTRLIRQHAPAPLLRAAASEGLHLGDVQRMLQVVSPLALAPRVPHGRRFLYAALGDRLASVDHAHDLWHHWDRPRAAWYHGSHVSFLWERDVKSLLEEAFAESGLLTA